MYRRIAFMFSDDNPDAINRTNWPNATFFLTCCLPSHILLIVGLALALFISYVIGSLVTLHLASFWCINEKQEVIVGCVLARTGTTFFVLVLAFFVCRVIIHYSCDILTGVKQAFKTDREIDQNEMAHDPILSVSLSE